MTRLNELLDASTFFSRQSFSYYNAENVNKSLDAQGFFGRETHGLFHGEAIAREVSNRDELEALIAEEKQLITEDAALMKKLAAVEKALNANVTTREFFKYISEHEELLPHFSNVDLFEQEVWKSYLKANEATYRAALDTSRTPRHAGRRLNYKPQPNIPSGKP